MILWIKPHGNRPNAQRFMLLSVNDKDTINVVSLGNNEIENVKIMDVCGVELDEHTWVTFDVKTWRRSG